MPGWESVWISDIKPELGFSWVTETEKTSTKYKKTDQLEMEIFFERFVKRYEKNQEKSKEVKPQAELNLPEKPSGVNRF